jgi:branched-chain amino acid transport system substrate-binding protein
MVPSAAKARLMRNFLVGAFAVILAISPLRASAADPYEINVILSLSGIAAFIGTQESAALKALETAENKKGGINGRPIHFNIVDDASSPVNAVQLANQIIATKVPVILGPTLTANCDAVYSLVKANGPVEYCFSPALHTPPGSFGFSSGAGTGDISTAAIRYYRERGLTRIALISSTDASGADGENVVLHSLSLPENKGMQLVANEHFAISDVSVGAQISRIKAANPQVIIAWTTGTPTGTVLRSLHDAGVDVPVQLNAGNIVRAQLKGYASFAPTELYLPGFRFMTPEMVAKGPLHDAQQAFFNALKEAGIPTAEVSHALGYDPSLTVINVLRKLPPNPTAVQVRDALEATHGISGVNSIIDYRDGSQRGVGINAVVIVRWDAAKEGFDAVSKPGGSPLKK